MVLQLDSITEHIALKYKFNDEIPFMSVHLSIFI